VARSLGLTAYRALSRRVDAQDAAPQTPRPKGELIWLHAAEAGSLIAVQDLANRLCANRLGINVLITVPDQGLLEPARGDIGGHLLQTIPNEHPVSIATFLDHWRPDACVWTWGSLRPNLILETAARRCPLFMIDADTGGFDGRRDRWLPDLTRGLLSAFEAVLTRSDAGMRRLVNLGMPRDKVELASPLMAGGQALPCNDRDLADLSQALVGRPVWFATRVLPQELQTVMSAHRQALRLSHRLLLILHPAERGSAAAVVQQILDRGFRAMLWTGEDFPDDYMQVMVDDDPAHIGLFYRIAPVSFLGSSLFSDHGGCDPFEAAALGSAVLYGPKVRHFMPSYTRLAAAGAARIVNDAPALGTAISRLIAPDQAATMAHAGWDVISQGAALTDRVIDLVQDALDQRAGAA